MVAEPFASVRMVSSRARHIIFLNRYFYPDHSATSEILSDLTFALSQRDFAVKVITSRLRYDDVDELLPAYESREGVEVFRVWTSRRGRYRLVGRVLAYVSFYVTAGWRLWRLTQVGTVIVAKTDPPLLSVIAAFIAWLRGAKLINWQQDVFPEIAEVIGLGGAVGRAGFAMLRGPRNWSLRQASFNVVVGNHMAETMRHLAVSPRILRIIPNWSDGKRIFPIEATRNQLRIAWGLKDSFVVGYAGNLGLAHEIDTVLGAIKALNSAPQDETVKSVKFLFVGAGALRPRLEKEVEILGLGNVLFRGYQPRERLALTLGAADVHLVILNPKLEGLSLPSKIYAIAAAGRPAIFIGDPAGEVAQLLSEGGFGFTVKLSDVVELKQRILELAHSPHLAGVMGDRARVVFEQRWDKALAVQRWEELLTELAD
jgi:colanic acid biosynthesis glycosyl transferase WcaI